MIRISNPLILRRKLQFQEATPSATAAFDCLRSIFISRTKIPDSGLGPRVAGADVGDDQKAPGRAGTTAFALLSEKSAGTSNLPVCRSYLQRQRCTTVVCMGLRPSTSASPDRVIRI